MGNRLAGQLQHLISAQQGFSQKVSQLLASYSTLAHKSLGSLQQLPA